MMQGGERLTNPAYTNMAPRAAVAEVPVITSANMTSYDAAIAPVATEAISNPQPLAADHFPKH